MHCSLYTMHVNTKHHLLHLNAAPAPFQLEHAKLMTLNPQYISDLLN